MTKKNRQKFLQIFAFVAFFFVALIILHFFYVQNYNQEILQKARDNGVLLWNQNKIPEDDGYILVQSFGIGCSLIKRDGSLTRKLNGMHCNMMENGDLITALYADNFHGSITKMRNYNRIWEVPNFVSHDISISPIDQSIWYINLEFENMENRRNKIDSIVNISQSGEEILRWRPEDHLGEIESLIDGPLKEPSYYKVDTIENGSFGRFHINSVEIIPPNNLMKDHPEFRAGNVLISDNYNGIALIFDKENRKVVWAFQAASKCGIHNAIWLTNGRILAFSNRSATSPSISNEKLVTLCHRGEQYHVPGVASYIEEIDPVSRKVVWSYTEPPVGGMCCRGLGSVQRRDNGNTLFSYGCEHSSIVEIDSYGAILWKWRYPQPTNGSAESPKQIYRAEWLPNHLVDRWIETQ
ncbi:MAG: hypothetical protein IPJ71_18850 [Bdellovibrionales bacterium]|nr:hypothetical protein [Bdellovibrionales bacterium]